MGTRADFYIGRGKDAEWLGSIGWDGYPEGINHQIFQSITVGDYREQVASFLSKRDDATFSEQGWPWPWDDSCTTDYAYAFDNGKVLACPFGHGWFVPTDDEPDELIGGAEFPNMKDKRIVAEPGSKRSGLMVFRG